jgi:TDG/mug DNA glycosylase family protein
MDPRTRQIYERDALDWIGARRPRAVEDGRMARFTAALPAGGRVADLGSGPGWYAAALREQGFEATALDLSVNMLREARSRTPGLPCACGDLAHLPFARGSLAGAFAINTYVHVPLAELPLALAELHGALAADGRVELTLANEAAFEWSGEHSDADAVELRGDREFAGRLFSLVSRTRARALLEDAGFEILEHESERTWHVVQARRVFTLPDFVAPDLRLLICGLNPSVYAAECGVPFGRPGNRFWPAAAAAGLIDSDRDPAAALAAGVGFTDLVKRPTTRASELDPEEYTSGMRRLQRVVQQYSPQVVCFVGLEGWRRAVDRKVRPGWLPEGVGGARAYLMPSTSGLNAHTDLAGFTNHLVTAAQ